MVAAYLTKISNENVHFVDLAAGDGWLIQSVIQIDPLAVTLRYVPSQMTHNHISCIPDNTRTTISMAFSNSLVL